MRDVKSTLKWLFFLKILMKKNKQNEHKYHLQPEFIIIYLLMVPPSAIRV